MSAFDWFTSVTNHPIRSPEDFRSGVYIKDLLETLDSRIKISLPNSNPRNNITRKFNWGTIIQCLQDNKIIAKGEFTPEKLFSDFSNQIISLLQKIQQKYCSQPQKVARLSKEKLSFFQDENGRHIQNLGPAQQRIAQSIQERIERYNRNINFTITYHPNAPVIDEPKKVIYTPPKQRPKTYIEPFTKAQSQFLFHSYESVAIPKPKDYKEMIGSIEKCDIISKFENEILKNVINYKSSNERIQQGNVTSSQPQETKIFTVTEKQKRLFGWGNPNRRRKVIKQ